MSTGILSFGGGRRLRALCLVLALPVLAYALGKAALDPNKVRLLLAASMLVPLLAFSQRRPMLVVYLLLLFLPFLGLLRRFLIPVAGWNSLDPFVIAGPLMILFLTTRRVYDRYFLRRETTVPDTRLFVLVRFMLLFDLVQVVNPLQGSMMTGVAGIMFYIAPVCYMILGRQYLDERKIGIVTGSVFAVAIVAALYGFKQFWFGYFSFENMWVELSGYTALKVYSVIRPISTFTSASEYAHYLGVASVIGWVYFLRGRLAGRCLALAGVALIYSALFIASARGIIVTATAAMTLVSIMSARKASHKVLIALTASVALAGLFAGISRLNTDNDLIYHSVVGLTDPLGEDSTTVGHYFLMIEGFRKGIANPVGHGLGSTTIAAGKFNGTAVSSEVDLSNKFLATGIVGGGLYLLIIVRTMALAFRQARLGRMQLIILGVLVAEAGQWLNGGHYSIAGFIWLLIGYLDKVSAKAPGDRAASA